MSTHSLNIALIGPASRFAHQQHEASLATSTDELAGLRFSILLTAKWEASDVETPERREELRAELRQLRAFYNDKLDEIAMAFGVSAALKAKEEIERSVLLPYAMMPPLDASEAEQDFCL